MKTFKLVLLFFIGSSINLFAQKEINGLPDDLNTETIIFLEYEQIPIDENTPKLLRGMYTIRNSGAITANEQLREKAKEYPFKYVISSRSEYKDSLMKDCRYVLENELMKKYNNGVNLATRSHHYLYADMYILDLRTGDIYLLFDINSNEAYWYKGIMKKFIKRVNAKFD